MVFSPISFGPPIFRSWVLNKTGAWVLHEEQVVCKMVETEKPTFAERMFQKQEVLRYALCNTNEDIF